MAWILKFVERFELRVETELVIGFERDIHRLLCSSDVYPLLASWFSSSRRESSSGPNSQHPANKRLQAARRRDSGQEERTSGRLRRATWCNALQKQRASWHTQQYQKACRDFSRAFGRAAKKRQMPRRARRELGQTAIPHTIGCSSTELTVRMNRHPAWSICSDSSRLDVLGRRLL
jgi:hypothetical protein